MTHRITSLIAITGSLLAAASIAATDPLTLQVEESLAALGYDTGPVDGEETIDTIIAISKFQAENDLAVTGEVTPDLATLLSGDEFDAAAYAAPVGSGSGAAPDASLAFAAVAAQGAPGDISTLQAAQQACLEQKMVAAQEQPKEKRRLGRLIGAVTRTAMRASSGDVSSLVSGALSGGQTIDDIAVIADALGLSQEEVADCQVPLGQ